MKKVVLALLMLICISIAIIPAYGELPKRGDEYKSPDFFNADDKYEAPYEIYIPKETDNTKNIHSNYSNNTDTCASCHSTHTAVGVALLQWNSVSETCKACHDGTVTTTYDVVNGKFLDYREGTYYPNSGGCFSTDTNDKNVSLHNVSENVLVSAAPGGSTVGVDARLRRSRESDYKNKAEVIAWDIPFTCASCHNPHGAGGNARLLQPDPNGIAQRNPIKMAQLYTIDESRKNWSLFPDLDDNGKRDMEWQDRPVKAYSLIATYPYLGQLKIYRKSDNTSYELITQYEIDNSSGSTVFKFSSDPSSNNTYNLYVDNALPGISVGMRIQNYLKYGEYVEYKYGINVFCAACHEDYNTATKQFFVGKELDSRYFERYFDQYGYYSGSGGKKEVVEGGDGTSGIYSQAYRHQVGMVWNTNTPGLKFERDPWDPDYSIIDRNNGRFIVNCLTCHVAHGVSRDYWERTVGDRDTDSDTEAVLPYGIFSYGELQEIQPSSALKRMPNMGVCEACHKKGEEAVQYSVNEEKD